MPDYSAPGVYLTESTGPRAIAGAPTDVAGFVGTTPSGPLEPTLVTSFLEFSSTYGSVEPPGEPADLAGAVRGYFENGGRRLWVARVDDTPDHPLTAWQAALDALALIEEISQVAAPGSTRVSTSADHAIAVRDALIRHVEAHPARFAVLDTPPETSGITPEAWRAGIDTSHAALYYPWLCAHGVLVPPSGHVCGIIARTDLNQGVHHAPVGPVFGVDGLESAVDDTRQSQLNALNINCFRTFARDDHRLWGARVASQDPEWRYVPVRRLISWLEVSIERGTQWAVFEPNNERLWANVADTIELFLQQLWRAGALLGRQANESFFVKCDRSTMTQNDLDTGRLVVVVGVAVLVPAELVVFRITQKTADAA